MRDIDIRFRLCIYGYTFSVFMALYKCVFIIIIQDGGHKKWNKPEVLLTLPKLIYLRDSNGKTHVCGEHYGAITPNARYGYHHDFQDGGQKTSMNRKYL